MDERQQISDLLERLAERTFPDDADMASAYADACVNGQVGSALKPGRQGAAVGGFGMLGVEVGIPLVIAAVTTTASTVTTVLNVLDSRTVREFLERVWKDGGPSDDPPAPQAPAAADLAAVAAALSQLASALEEGGLASGKARGVGAATLLTLGERPEAGRALLAKLG